jgi:hypothetical protein
MLAAVAKRAGLTLDEVMAADPAVLGANGIALREMDDA